MGYMTINNRTVEFTDERNVLTVIRNAGIEIPTFCYHSELSTYGACRMCVVEDDRGKVFASCSERPKDGMVIYTNTQRLRRHRRMILELLIASHCTDCTTCEANGICDLQRLARQLGITRVRFDNYKNKMERDESSDCVIRDPNKCILCGDCVRVCEEIEGVGILNFAGRGSKLRITTAFDRPLSQTDCVGCGQCRAVCPTGAITIKQEVGPVWKLLANPDVRVVAQLAPAVRVAVGEEFDLPEGENQLGVLTAALRQIGFDEVYDTNFAADLTVIEEANELVERLQKEENLPLFTSCCPAWVKFCEERYPQFAGNISTCRSPQEMFGAIIKEDARLNREWEGRRTVVVSIMPCTAKKAEVRRPEHFDEDGQIVDYVLTTVEISNMIKEAGMDLTRLEPEALDMPFGMASGGGAIFGTTGGVTEAVLRYLTKSSKGADLDAIRFSAVRGNENIRETEVELGGKTVRIAIVHGLKGASEILDKMEAGQVEYDFVEVMACRQGCIGGGGQPYVEHAGIKGMRKSGLYHIDSLSQIKQSGQNPIVADIYEGILKGKEHKLLHNEK